MADTPSIADRVRAVVAETMGKPIEQITDQATFETLEADSLDVVETAIALDEEFEPVRINDEHFTMHSTVADLIAEVEKAHG
jgi:acyl carrier protein